MVISERAVARTRLGAYERLLMSTIGAIAAVGIAGVFLNRALPGSPALRCVAFVIFGATAFLAATVWWKVAFEAIGHSADTAIPPQKLHALGALVATIAALTIGEYALFAWTQSRIVEAVSGIVASFVTFGYVGELETRRLAPPTVEHVRRLRTIGRMFAIVAAVIVVDLAIAANQPQLARFAWVREIQIALGFATAPAMLVGAWFVRRRYTKAA